MELSFIQRLSERLGLALSAKPLESQPQIANHLHSRNIRVGIDNRMESAAEHEGATRPICFRLKRLIDLSFAIVPILLCAR
jgi:hypothetical protein